WPASTHSSRRAAPSDTVSSYSASAASGCENKRVRNDGSVTVRSSTAWTASVDIWDMASSQLEYRPLPGGQQAYLRATPHTGAALLIQETCVTAVPRSLRSARAPLVAAPGRPSGCSLRSRSAYP